MTAETTIGLVGIGTIAETHLAVLSEISDVSLEFTVDPDPNRSVTFRHTHPPRYVKLIDALGEHQPDLVVITAPTHAHADLAHDALTNSDARILVEKPLVHDLAALATLRSFDPTINVRSRVMVAHHFAFSSEVTWAARQLDHHPDWGPITSLTSAFHDPYITDAEHSFAAYTSSWIDSGVNQLSMLSRFVEPTQRGPLHETDNGATAWCNVTYDSKDTIGTALLRTSWQAIASSKRTTLHLAQSDTEVWLDHTAVTAFITRDGQILDSLTNDGRTPRKIAHYRPLYQSLLSPTPDPILSFDTAAKVTELLHRPQPS